jgi:hypothetical protein
MKAFGQQQLHRRRGGQRIRIGIIMRKNQNTPVRRESIGQLLQGFFDQA